MSSRRVSAAAALAGAVAVGLALAVGEVLAAVVPDVVPVVTAVSQQVVPLAPGDLTAWAIETLGRANTVVLEIGTVALAVSIGAGTAVLATRTFAGAALVFAGFGGLGLSATLAQPEAGWAAVPVLVAVVAAGLAALRMLLGRLASGVAPAGAEDASPTPTDPPVARRSFLGLAAGTGAVAVVGAAGARLLLSRVTGGTDPATVALPPRRARSARCPPVPPTTSTGSRRSSRPPIASSASTRHWRCRAWSSTRGA